MALTSAEIQARYRARKQRAGRRGILVFVTPKEARYIRAFLRGRGCSRCSSTFLTI